MTHDTDADGPFNTEAAARFIGMSASWLEKSRVRGDGPRFRKTGARVVYDKAELEMWRAAFVRTSTAEYETPRRSPRVLVLDREAIEPWLAGEAPALSGRVDKDLHFFPVIPTPVE